MVDDAFAALFDPAPLLALICPSGPTVKVVPSEAATFEPSGEPIR